MYIYTYIHIYMNIDMYVYIYNIHIYIYAYSYTYTYMHTHIDMLPCASSNWMVVILYNTYIYGSFAKETCLFCKRDLSHIYTWAAALIWSKAQTLISLNNHSRIQNCDDVIQTKSNFIIVTISLADAFQLIFIYHTYIYGSFAKETCLFCKRDLTSSCTSSSHETENERKRERARARVGARVRANYALRVAGSPWGQGRRGGGLGSRPKKMYGERLGDGVEYHSMKPTPRR